MRYHVHKINNRDQIESCELFHINQYMWNSKIEPKTYGWVGYLENEGLYVKMVCDEVDPKRECQNHKEMVCKDSAMEIFFAFTEIDDSIYQYFCRGSDRIKEAKSLASFLMVYSIVFVFCF